jgi:hypothetical protein
MHDGVVINGYGPTESTTFACCFRMTKDYRPGPSVPIGQPIARTVVHVLDDRMQRVETGRPGELYIGGDGLAAGYLNNEELTRARFVADPFSADPDAKLYRTGDRVRELPDGNLDFLGRIDHQVKIRGHRVELGEIEATLQAHPQVRQAVVVARSEEQSEEHLVAYFVTEERSDCAANELKRHLSMSLPEYMIPSDFVRLGSLPLNSNGKLDRSALPAPNWQRPVETASGTGRDGLEDRIAALWGRILGRAVGLDDNFFDLGGSSLRLIELQAELAKFCDHDISLVELFEHTTVRSLAAHLSGSRSSPAPVATSAAGRAKLQREAFARRLSMKGPGR